MSLRIRHTLTCEKHGQRGKYITSERGRKSLYKRKQKKRAVTVITKHSARVREPRRPRTLFFSSTRVCGVPLRPKHDAFSGRHVGVARFSSRIPGLAFPARDAMRRHAPQTAVGSRQPASLSPNPTYTPKPVTVSACSISKLHAPKKTGK